MSTSFTGSRRFLISSAVLLSALTGTGQAVAQGANGNGNGKDLPVVVVLATGGTIAGAAASDVQAGYSSGQVGVEQLLNAVPQAKRMWFVSTARIAALAFT